MGISSFIINIKLKKWKKNGLKVGANFVIEKGCSIEPSFPWLVTIGDNVTLAPNVTILGHDASTRVQLGLTKLGKVKIGNNVFVGAGSIILPNVEIGNDVVIAAGSVVNRNIPNDSVVAGVPAKKIKSCSDFKKIYQDKMNNGEKLDKSFTISGNVTDDKKEKMINFLDNGKNVFIV